MNRLFRQITPFLIAGIGIAAFIFGMMLLMYLILFGILVGSVLYLANWIRLKFFPPKQPSAKKSAGRVIDSTDWKKH